MAKEARQLAEALAATSWCRSASSIVGARRAGAVATHSSALRSPRSRRRAGARPHARRRPDPAEDLKLLRDQSDRCRDGRAAVELDARRRAARADAADGAGRGDDGAELLVRRRDRATPGDRIGPEPAAAAPGASTGAGDPIENAVDFATAKDELPVALGRQPREAFRIIDDGRLFRPEIARIGDENVDEGRAWKACGGRTLGVLSPKMLLERVGVGGILRNSSWSGEGRHGGDLVAGARSSSRRRRQLAPCRHRSSSNSATILHDQGRSGVASLLDKRPRNYI